MALRSFNEDVPADNKHGGGAPSPEEQRAMMQPLVKAALDRAIAEILHAAEAAIKEERANGRPGDKWDELLLLISSLTHIPADDRLRLVLVARLAFLLVAARNLLPPNTDIDPNTTQFRD